MRGLETPSGELGLKRGEIIVGERDHALINAVFVLEAKPGCGLFLLSRNCLEIRDSLY
jgi:hypothetical protein